MIIYKNIEKSRESLYGEYTFLSQKAPSARAAQYYRQNIEKSGVLIRLVFEIGFRRGEKFMVVLTEGF